LVFSVLEIYRINNKHRNSNFKSKPEKIRTKNMLKMENQKSNQKLESQTATCSESERRLSTKRGGREIKKIDELGERERESERVLPTIKKLNINRCYITKYSHNSQT
jgi:hypothetical protein